jgi:hypothetical protein
VYPRDFMLSDGKVISMISVYDEIFGGLRFAGSHGYDYVVILKKKRNSVCANVVTVFRAETLKDVF